MNRAIATSYGNNVHPANYASTSPNYESYLVSQIAMKNPEQTFAREWVHLLTIIAIQAEFQAELCFKTKQG